MSFTEPLSVTISGTTTPLPRTSVGTNQSEYTSANGLIVVKASHTYGKRTRRMLRIDTSKLSPDVLQPTINAKKSMSLYMVFDTPDEGFDNVEELAVYQGFKTLITATSDDMIKKLLGGES
jgi:hypothetical protein